MRNKQLGRQAGFQHPTTSLRATWRDMAQCTQFTPSNSATFGRKCFRHSLPKAQQCKAITDCLMFSSHQPAPDILRHGDAQPCGRKPSVVFLRLPAQPHPRENHGKHFGRDDTESLHLAGHPRICTMSQCQASECSRSRELKTQALDLEVSNISFSSLPSQESCLCCQV